MENNVILKKQIKIYGVKTKLKRHFKLKNINFLKSKKPPFKAGKPICKSVVIKTPISLTQNRYKVFYKVKKPKFNQANIIANYKQNKRLISNYSLVFKLNKKVNYKLQILYLLAVGLFIGFVNGFWGGGGGMICVPTLTMLLKLPDKKAHATTILIMLPLSVASFIVYLLKGSIEWGVAGFVGGGFVLGGIVGAIILKNINNLFLRIVFSLVIIAGAIKMLI